MSISNESTCDFEQWIASEFAEDGSFTALIVLVHIVDTKVAPLCSTYLNVIGDELCCSRALALIGAARPSFQ